MGLVSRVRAESYGVVDGQYVRGRAPGPFRFMLLLALIVRVLLGLHGVGLISEYIALPRDEK